MILWLNCEVNFGVYEGMYELMNICLNKLMTKWHLYQKSALQQERANK